MKDILTIQDVRESMQQMNAERDNTSGVTFVKSNWLKGSQTVIKSGDKVYYADLQTGDVKVIEIPVMKMEFPEMKVKY